MLLIKHNLRVWMRSMHIRKSLCYHDCIHNIHAVATERPYCLPSWHIRLWHHQLNVLRINSRVIHLVHNTSSNTVTVSVASMNEWMNQWINEWMNQSINQSINQLFSQNQSVGQSINQSMNQWINQSVNESINQSIIRPKSNQNKVLRDSSYE